MEIKISRQVNGASMTFTVEAKDEKEAISQALFYAERDYCPLEGFEKSTIRWQARKTKGEKGEFIYLERRCYDDKGRNATSVAGTYQDGGYFWKKWEIYDPAVEASK